MLYYHSILLLSVCYCTIVIAVLSYDCIILWLWYYIYHFSINFIVLYDVNGNIVILYFILLIINISLYHYLIILWYDITITKLWFWWLLNHWYIDTINIIPIKELL